MEIRDTSQYTRKILISQAIFNHQQDIHNLKQDSVLRPQSPTPNNTRKHVSSQVLDLALQPQRTDVKTERDEYLPVARLQEHIGGYRFLHL